jgi:hypothetical protein
MTHPPISAGIPGADPHTKGAATNSTRAPASVPRAPWLSLRWPANTNATIFAASDPVNSQPNEAMPPRSFAAAGSTTSEESSKPIIVNSTNTPIRVARSRPVNGNGDGVGIGTPRAQQRNIYPRYRRSFQPHSAR